MIKVSIIVPVYNAEKFLRQCLESIQAQTLQDIEVILINDGSDDDSIKICQEFVDKDARFFLYTQENQGAGVARDNGISLAKGEYIGFVDSDDWIEPETFEKMYSAAMSYSVDVVRCNTVMHKGKQTEIRWNPPCCNRFISPDEICKEIIPLLIAPKNEKEYNNRLLRGCVCNIFKRKIILQNNIHFTKLKSGEDVLFTIENLLVSNGLVILPEHFYHYMFYNNDSLSKSSSSIDLKQRNELRTRMKDLVINTVGFNEIEKRWKQEDRRLIYLDVRIIAVYSSGETVREKIKKLKSLLDSTECRVAFSDEISKELPFQMYILYWLIKNKMAKVLYWLVRIKFKGEIKK